MKYIISKIDEQTYGVLVPEMASKPHEIKGEFCEALNYALDQHSHYSSFPIEIELWKENEVHFPNGAKGLIEKIVK